MADQALIHAIAAWRDFLPGGVITDRRKLEAYNQHTLGAEMGGSEAVLLPSSVEEVIKIVQVASEHHVPLYPISVGNNWGYGSSTAPTNGCVTVDLSRMNSIVSVDKDLGLVTVEPGVTSGQLEKFLREAHLPFMAPIIGAGPGASLVGNALDRGHAVGVPADRFASIMSLEAVLADGSTFRSSSVAGGSSSPSFFKWGIGPHLDGLFGQSGMGIVVRVTFALAPLPEQTLAFCIVVKEDSVLSDVVDTFRTLLRSLGSTLSCVHLSNGHKTVSRISPYPDNLVDNHMPDSFVRETLARAGLSGWIILGALQGEEGMVRAAERIVKARIGGYARQQYFFDRNGIHTHIKYGWKRIFGRTGKTRPLFRVVHTFFHSIVGENLLARRDVPLWRNKADPSEESPYMSRHGELPYDSHAECGLMYFSVVLPMRVGSPGTELEFAL